MSAISSVTSTSNPYPIADQGGFGQIVKDFNSIGNALQTGDVASAQTAMSAFQQDLQNNPQTSASQPFGNNSQANTDFQSLAGALQTGNLSSAQNAFASLQTDLKAAQTSTTTAHKGHHRHHGGGGVSAASLINSLTTDSTTTSTSSTTTSSAAVSEGSNTGSGLNVTA